MKTEHVRPTGQCRRRISQLPVRAGVRWAAGVSTVLWILGSPALATSVENEKLDNEQVVRAFIADWSQLDAEKLVDYFTDDGTYHNMMLDPVSGRENLLEFINGFLSNWNETHWELLHIVSQDELVMAERVDRTRIGDRSVALPCVGVFEMQGGKIKVWRDYFDMATYTNAFADGVESGGSD